jgi:hypothetical protein
LGGFRDEITKRWQWTLQRRSQKGSRTWEQQAGGFYRRNLIVAVSAVSAQPRPGAINPTGTWNLGTRAATSSISLDGAASIPRPTPSSSATKRGFVGIS